MSHPDPFAVGAQLRCRQGCTNLCLTVREDPANAERWLGPTGSLPSFVPDCSLGR